MVEVGVRAARLIGRGLYGVDVKQNERGVFVIEVNDNPNLIHDAEDAAERDAFWRRLAAWFLRAAAARRRRALTRPAACPVQGGVSARPSPRQAP